MGRYHSLCLEAGERHMMLCHRVPAIETVQTDPWHRGTIAPSDQSNAAQQHVAKFKKNLSPPQKCLGERLQRSTEKVRISATAVVFGEEEPARNRNRSAQFAGGEILSDPQATRIRANGVRYAMIRGLTAWRIFPISAQQTDLIRPDAVLPRPGSSPLPTRNHINVSQGEIRGRTMTQPIQFRSQQLHHYHAGALCSAWAFFHKRKR